MKAVIVDIVGNHAVALSQKGEFIKLRNKAHYEVGCEIDIPGKAWLCRAAAMKKLSIAAAFLLVMGIGAGAYSYNIPYSYINVYINPSIEFTANIYNRIIDAKGLNEEGNRLLSLQSYKNKTIRESVEIILQAAYEQGYLSNSPTNTVVFALSGKNQQTVERIQKEIKTTAEQKLQKVESETELVVEKLQTSQHNDAMEQGISPAKMLLINKLREAKPEVKIDDIKDRSMEEIMKSIKDAEKGGKNVAFTAFNRKNAGNEGKDPKVAGKEAKKADKKDNKKNENKNKNHKEEDKGERKEISKSNGKNTWKTAINSNGKDKTDNDEKRKEKKNNDDRDKKYVKNSRGDYSRSSKGNKDDKDNKGNKVDKDYNNKYDKNNKGNKNDNKSYKDVKGKNDKNNNSYDKTGTQSRGGQIRISNPGKTAGNQARTLNTGKSR